MTTTADRLKQSLSSILTAALVAACADQTPVGPDRDPVFQAQPAAGSSMAAGPQLGTCGKLAAPAGATFAFHVYARGVQIDRWNGTAWAPVAPRAELYADAGGKGLVGTHYAGPYWESLGGSRVKGTLIDRCTADASAIDWLSLAGAPEGAPGVFQHVTFIQRVNTAGGRAPSTGGALDEVREVPYTTEYYFYRAP
jgi:hypothetical protein